MTLRFLGWRCGSNPLTLASEVHGTYHYIRLLVDVVFYYMQLSVITVDALARVPKKDAANCETHRDVRNSVNRQIFERI